MELTDMFMPNNIYSHVNYASFSGTGLQKTVFRGKGFQRCEKGSNVNKQKNKIKLFYPSLHDLKCWSSDFKSQSMEGTCAR